MKTLKILYFLVFSITAQSLLSQDASDFEIRGICIAAPETGRVDSFVYFIDKVLAPAYVNTLILRVDYNFPFKSYPQLRDEDHLTLEEINQIKKACRDNNIQIIPQINLFGHQSWHSAASNLLQHFPQFDETPHINLPEKYQWPNEDELYCKSYCPNHPEVHEVVFELVDEMVKVFEAKAFHAGLDEVFYICDSKCPRCSGLDPAEVFAAEVSKIRNHLSGNNVRLWIWGDRLIDGKATGIGLWEASLNNTHRAIDMIPQDVLICDWHYEKAHPTAALFALKGFDVVECPWRKPEVAKEQVAMLHGLISNSSDEVAARYKGIVHTVWISAERFIQQYFNRIEYDKSRGDMPATFKACFEGNE